MWIWITTIISGLVLIGLLLFKKAIKGHENSVNFIISILATFIGVFWGIYFTNAQNIKEDKEHTTLLIETTIEELRLQEEKVELILGHIDITDTNGLSQLKKPLIISQLLHKILDSDNIIKHFSIDTYSKLTVSLENMRLYEETLKAEPLQKKHIYFYLCCIKIECGYSKTLLKNELLFQNEKINNDELKLRIKRYTGFKEFIDSINFGGDSIIVSHYTPDMSFTEIREGISNVTKKDIIILDQISKNKKYNK